MPTSPAATAAQRWGAPPAPIAYRPRPDQRRQSPPPPLTRPVPTPALAPPAARPQLLALLTPAERPLFDAAVAGACDVHHAESAASLATAMRARPADGAVLSAAALAAAGPRALAHAAAFARAYSATPLVALVSADVSAAVLVALGRSNARAVLDVRGPAGWAAVQSLWPAAGVRTLAHRAAEVLEDPLDNATPGMRRFTLGLFDAPPRVRTVRSYAPRFGVLPTTMMSRFFRAGLPAPRRYLALARLARAAQLFESPRWTVGAVAAELDHSSAQAFSRHLHLQLGVRPREFRARYDGAGMVRRFAEEVITPYQAVLRTFEPF